jgi:propionaldehyde dehydrogenase
MIDEQEINRLVKSVLEGMNSGKTEASSASQVSPKSNKRQLGVFDTMEEAIDACNKAYTLFRNYNKEQRENIITEIKKLTHAEAEIMGKLGVEDTKMGNAYHKTLKHHLIADKTPGTEDLETRALSGDRGLTLVEMAPYGIIGAITPSTNPSETVICNSIGMLAAGNGVVFNPHPHAKEVSKYAVDLVNRAVLAAGGPENIVVTVNQPTMETSNVMVNHPSVRMLVATGGPGVVKMLLSSGKKAIGAGAGNPPVIVDDTADIKKAAKDIIDGCTFDNNLPCIAEKECFVLRNVADELIHYMLKNGAYLISGEQVKQLEDVVLVTMPPKKPGDQPKRVINKDWVGRDAKKILAQIGIEVGDDIRCIICETEFSQAFVQTELMMPILPIVRVETFDEAVEMAVKAEHGNRHSAHLHSKNVDHMTQYAKAICTTIFVKNAPSYAGIGFNSEGHTTFTIAGPTGEGLTSARSFTRQRRCVLVDSLNII